MLIFLSLIDDDEGKEKFGALYNLYRKKMFFVANEILHNECDAEDAVQETLLSLARNIKNVDVVHSKKAYYYVMTITENTALNLLKKKKGESRKIINLDFDDDSWLFVSDSDIAEDSYLKKNITVSSISYKVYPIFTAMCFTCIMWKTLLPGK